MRTLSSLNRICRLLPVVLLGTLCLSPARADYNVSAVFAPSSAAAHPGDTLTYDVTFTNHELFDINLTNISLDLVNPPAGFDPAWIQPIFNPASLLVAAGTAGNPTVTQAPDLFSLVLDPALAGNPSYLTTYSGTMAFTDDVGGVVSGDFSVSVAAAPIPEAAGVCQISALLGMGGLGIWGLRRRTR